MRLRNIPGAREAVENSPCVVQDPHARKGCWRSLFAENSADRLPLHVEIGAGKGRFLAGMAQNHADCAFVGIERYATVLYKALRRMPEDVKDRIRFVCMDAELIAEVFDRGEVDRLYLNFSDPWPKARHENRRLTSRSFLARYERILRPGGVIAFKTDNRALFDWSLEEAELAGWRFLEQTFDLHADARLCEGNVMTEYEEKFSAQGHPICKYIITKEEPINGNHGE